MLEDVPYPGVCGLRRSVCGKLFLRGLHRDLSALIRLRIRVKKVLHGQPPDLFAALEPRNDRRPPAACCQELPCSFRIPDRRRQSDPPGAASRKPAHPLDQAECLHPAVAPKERMDLVDHDEAKIVEQGRDLHVLVDHQRFQRLRRDLQDPGRMFHDLPLPGLRDIAVPAVNGDPLFFAQLVQAPELVVDQRLERRDIEHADALRRILVKQRQNREKGRLRLP